MRLPSSRLIPLVCFTAAALALTSTAARATPEAAWPSTSLLAQDGGGSLPPPDSLQADPADDGAAPPPPAAPDDDKSGDRRGDRAPGAQKDKADDGEPKPFDDALREKIPDLPAPALGALGAAIPVAAVSAVVLTVNLSLIAGGLGADLVLQSILGSAIGLLGVAIVGLLGATLSVFLAGGAVLWLLGEDATTTEWEHLSMATLATLLFFIVAPALLLAEFFGFPCLSMCCPAGGLNAFAPRISRPVYWTLGASFGGALVGLLLGGVIGAALAGPALTSPFGGAQLLALRAIAIGSGVGFSVGATVAAPLGAAIGGSFGIMAPATGE
jgi:hypothetical protein